jgi:hypothetical protein
MAKEMNDHRITVNPAAVASFHDDGLVILNSRSGLLFTSNPTGARIWRCIERQLPLEAIALEISAEYQITQTTAREHTARFLADLERQELIERRAGL